MRSRYTAYSVGDVRHIMATTHPDSLHHQADEASWEAEIEAFCGATSFEGLDVELAQEDGERGWVRFEARLRRDANPVAMREHSEFRRVNGRWLYLQATESDR